MDGRAVRAVRVRTPDAVVAVAEPAEPATSTLLAPLFEPGVGRSCQVWELRSGDEVVGAVVATRAGLDVWTAWVHVAPGWEAAAGPAVGTALDRSPARVAHGEAGALTAAAPHVRRLRARRERRGVWAWTPREGDGGDPPAGTRLATTADVAAVVALFARADPGAARSPRQLARALRHDVAGDGVLVAERGGVLVGAVTTTGHTRRFVVGGALCVDPAAPAAEVARDLWAAGRLEAARRGLGLVADRPPRVGRRAAAGGPRADLALFPRQRFRGQRRLVDPVLRAVRHLTA